MLGLGTLVYDVIDRGNVMGWATTICVALGFLAGWALIALGIRWLDRGRPMRADLGGGTLTLFAPTGAPHGGALATRELAL